ncbi:MAG: hypothetical protein KIT58_04320 [Planctomycetota bacterium]|nr:hypothetical protein [Planctomycetota bacterium]
MADLRKTKEEWARFLGLEVATFLACLLELQELEDRFARSRVRVAVLNDPAGNVGPTGVTLRGVRLGRNTSPGGLLVARVQGAQDPRTVTLLRAPGGQPQDVVAEGQGPAGTLVVLAERNQSQLAGTWDLARAPTVDLSDRLLLAPLPDWQARAAAVWDGTFEKDARAREEFVATCRLVAARLADARLLIQDALAQFATRLGGRGAEFLGSAQASLVTEAPTRDPSGSIGRRTTGFLPSLARAMAEDTRAGEQSLTERVVRAGPAVFAASNDGQGRVLAHVPREWCPAARWVFRCVRGKDTGHGGREEFEGTATVLGEDRQVTFSGVRVRQSFAGPEGIGPFTVEHVLTKAGDPQDQALAPAEQASTAGERDPNTDGGVLYWRVEKGLSGFDVSFFRSANRTAGELVARAEGLAPGAVFQATERTASGLQVTWRLGPQPVHGAEGALDLSFFVTENPAGLPDEFEITTTVVREGLFQKALAEQLGAALFSRPQGQASIPDGCVQAGTLLAFLERRES